ncbi:MAG: D-alanine--D-alanine ligase [Vicinamibacteria bacterium]
MSGRIRVGVLMGGASSERDISLASGQMIAQHLPPERYEVVMLDTLALMAHNPKISSALRAQARALAGPRSTADVAPREGGVLPAAFQAEIDKAALAVSPATAALSASPDAARIDVAFPALHGPYGEDGTIQGMLEVLGVPYVGSGTLASALAMDKTMAKKVFAADGIPLARGFEVRRADFASDPQGTVDRVAALLPVVVKPVHQGSSIGIGMASRRDELERVLRDAFAFDPRVLVEERVVGTELTAAVIGNRELQALPLVEIVAKRAFFDYEAKYDPAASDEICPARVSPEVTREAQEIAMRAHRALGCRGLSRTDLIATEDRGLFVLELNTLPGMTVNSLLPKAARAAGIPFPDLLDRLVQLALEEE